MKSRDTYHLAFFTLGLSCYSGNTKRRTPPMTSPLLASPLCDPAAMQLQLEAFVRDGVWASAQLLGELLVALAAADAPVDGADARTFHARSYFLFAELLAARRELKRAIVRAFVCA